MAPVLTSWNMQRTTTGRESGKEREREDEFGGKGAQEWTAKWEYAQ
jgi:hypothetical protein